MKKVIIILSIVLVLIIGSIFLFKKEPIYMENLVGKKINEINDYILSNELILELHNKESLDIEKDVIMEQSIEIGSKIKKGDALVLNVSSGKPLEVIYEENNVNELGNVPIMMYHGIHNVKSVDTAYIGGNVDRDGYQRTSEAFRSDLEFYYNKGYRMIRLIDYVNGIVDVPLGMSPLVITFDDGLINNIKVTGLDEIGNIIIDPECAIGILEEFKKKYDDFNVTATFFLNGGLFNQGSYNEKILNWLVTNNYDIGNHTYSHLNISNISTDKTIEEVGKMYKLFDKYNVPYVNIVALPFGAPYDMNHSNFSYVLNGTYDGTVYETVATLRVGWESELSPFNENFNKKYLKRIRAYDNNGTNFDIEHNFKMLDNNKYISDGDKENIVVKKKDLEKVGNSSLKIISY